MIPSRPFVCACVLLLGLNHVGSGRLAADTLDDALRASLQNSSQIAAARQGWLAARETIQTKTSTSDLKATFSASGNQSYTDTVLSNGYKQSQYGSGSVTMAKNLLVPRYLMHGCLISMNLTPKLNFHLNSLFIKGLKL